MYVLSFCGFLRLLSFLDKKLWKANTLYGWNLLLLMPVLSLLVDTVAVLLLLLQAAAAVAAATVAGVGQAITSQGALGS